MRLAKSTLRGELSGAAAVDDADTGKLSKRRSGKARN
jgi:hypothetical protein